MPPRTFHRILAPPQAAKISDNLGFYTKFNDPVSFTLPPQYFLPPFGQHSPPIFAPPPVPRAVFKRGEDKPSPPRTFLGVSARRRRGKFLTICGFTLNLKPPLSFTLPFQYFLPPPYFCSPQFKKSPNLKCLPQAKKILVFFFSQRCQLYTFLEFTFFEKNEKKNNKNYI